MARRFSGSVFGGSGRLVVGIDLVGNNGKGVWAYVYPWNMPMTPRSLV